MYSVFNICAGSLEYETLDICQRSHEPLDILDAVSDGDVG